MNSPVSQTQGTQERTQKRTLHTGNRIQNTLEPCVVLMKQLISKHSDLWIDKGGIFSLAQGVVYWEPPKSTYAAIRSAIDISSDNDNDNDNHAPEISTDLHQYGPDEGLPSLIQAVKLKLERENNLPTETTQVMITNGANQAYMNCVLSLLSEHNQHDNENDNNNGNGGDVSVDVDVGVVFKPYYFNHVMAIQMVRGDDALLVGPVDTFGFPDVDWLRNTLMESSTGVSSSSSSSSSSPSPMGSKRIRMVTVTNPGNPTGVSLPREKLQEIVDVCREFHVWLVMDNTYEHFDHEKANSFLISHDTDDNNDNNNNDSNDETSGDIKKEPTEGELGYHCFKDEHVINIFSFSKGYAMAGFRVGYVAINAVGKRGEDAYHQMLKVQDTIPICTSRISQLAALGAMSAGRSWVVDKVSTLDKSREAILKALQPLETIGGSGAMYVMAKLPPGLDDLEVGEMFVEKYGIAIIPGSFCGFPGWIRVCYSNLSPQDCIIAAGRLEKGINNLCK